MNWSRCDRRVLLVAFVVEDGELRRVEKSAGVEAVELKEVAPVLSAVGEIEGAALRCRRCRTRS